MIGFQKPEPRRRVVARAKRAKAEARRACIEAVFARERGRCQRCRRQVLPYWDVRATEFTVGHTHEIKSRARGGDPTDPANCELLCWKCHPVAHGQRVAGG